MSSLRARCRRPFHASQRELGDRRDVLVAESLDVAQDEHGAVVRAEQRDLALEALAPLASLASLERRRRGAVRAGRLGVADRVLLEVDRLGPAKPGLAQRGVVGDLQQPSPERALAAEAVEPVEGAKEGVLAHVGGVVSSDDPRRHSVDDVAMALHQRAEGLEAPGSRSGDELLVGIGGHGVRDRAAPVGITRSDPARRLRVTRRSCNPRRPGRI